MDTYKFSIKEYWIREAKKDIERAKWAGGQMSWNFKYAFSSLSAAIVDLYRALKH